MKKVLGLFVVFSAFFTAGVYADDGLQKVEAFLRPDFKVVVNHQTVTLEDPPLIYNGNSYLPVRELGELVGAGIEWQESNKSILIENRSASGPTGGTTTDAGSQNGSTGGAIGTDSQGGSTGAPAVDQSKIPDNILLGTLIRYNITYMDKQYPVLGNQFRGSLYLLASDVQQMGINLFGLKLSQDKITKDMYVQVDELEGRWAKTPSRMDLLDGPVIIGEKNPDKIKLLSSLFNYNYVAGSKVATMTVYHVKALSAPNEYEFLCGYSNHLFIGYQVRLLQNSDGTWTYSTTGTLNLDNSATVDY